jgi:hypothetical protein
VKSTKAVAVSKFESQIAKTGFVLENNVAQTLKKSGWTVISNRYYLDDTGEETVREIDLIAYKVRQLPDFRVYTSLIISCKKSEKDAWALLSRPIDLTDPNADWWPVHLWSNNKPVGYEFATPDMSRRYHDAMAAAGVANALALPSVEVFAYQEMDKHSGTPHNQKNIFQAITSLIKAQSYELQSLPQRRKDPAVYQFNLLSVVDADLVRLHFDGGTIKADSITDEHYITRYIVSKRTTVARVRFIRADHLQACLKDYANLHTANCDWIGARHEDFFRESVKEPRVQVFLPEFRSKVCWYLRHKAKGKLNQFEDADLSLQWLPEKNALAIAVLVGDDTIDGWNSDTYVRGHVASVLAKLYRYKGAFHFSSDIPF